MTPQQIADNRTDLLTFTRTMFRAVKGSELIDNWHQKAICDALERVVIGDCKRLIINVPPRSGKTELAVKNFMAWGMGNFPDSEFIHASYSKRLAAANTYAVRAMMQDDTYLKIFDHTALAGDSKAKDEFRTAQGGIVYATGADGTITGFGAGKMRDTFGGAIIIDDPHKAGEANSAVMRQNVIDWFQNTMESRKNSPDTPIIIIMQRLHENDLSGFLLDGGNGENWEHLCIAALDEQDESFWPKQFKTEDLHRQRASNSYVFAGQMMQTPAPAGGGIFKSSWWRYYRALPEFNHRMIYADTAMKTGEMNDYSVLQCWGKSGDSIYLIDQVRGKWEAPQLLAQAKSFWAKHQQGSGQLRQFKIEDKASGTGLIQQLKQSGVPVTGIPRDKDKVTRAYDVAPMVEVGRVWLPEDAAFMGDLIHELDTFPVGAHDDQVDPLMDAITDLLITRPKDFFFL
ncbi:terminase large subunit [Idiomarinaceae phage 1N2-2]|uniref:terminase large subunit n=1 Tax=Idiomarinaceae phage 1N2-2 TaxID=1536592 RepID=UPI0004F79E79|nr:terminase large subunit [Idiomarinaceae phage 1N2-2]AIM40704.1 putative large terminase [Idiomarinaceae phage 1N2-2]